MENLKGISLPEIYAYKLVIVPTATVGESIMQEKKRLTEKYRCDAENSGRPAIALAIFSQQVVKEERLLMRLRSLAHAQKELKIELRDYGCLPSHSLFITVSTKNALQELVKNIRTQCGPLMKLDNKHTPLFITEPQILLARKLKPWQFEKAWLEYQHRFFSARFIASEMRLLKRLPAAGMYETVESFSFNGEAVFGAQASLF